MKEMVVVFVFTLYGLIMGSSLPLNPSMQVLGIIASACCGLLVNAFLELNPTFRGGQIERPIGRD